MPSMLRLIDRSRVADGRGFCKRARFNNYHVGPNGYGIALKGTKVPLMTGIGAHEGLAPILEWCRQHPTWITTPPDDVIREGIKAAVAKYWKTVEARGFAYLQASEDVKAVTQEQTYLVEGIIWAWCIEVLPHILERGQIIEVEVDDIYVIGCTCGLGDGTLTAPDHEARDCAGYGWMCKPDFLVLTRLTQELEYHEFKTTGMDTPTFKDKWEVMIQMFAATLDAERRLQKHVQTIYVHGLIKGKYQGDYQQETGKYDGPRKQQSIFCYGYRRTAIPPMEGEEWAAQYNYTDSDGKNRRLTKDYRKAGVWELPDYYLEGAQATTPGITKAEFWAKWLPTEVRKKQLILLGPFSRQTQMVSHFVDETVAEEQTWDQGLWAAYDLAQSILEAQPEHLTDDPQRDWWRLVWPNEDFQRLIDRLFPRSYECRRYGARARCQFEDLCFKREGWDDPVLSGKFILRRPHHAPELTQAVDRGLLVPDDGLSDEVEQEIP